MVKEKCAIGSEIEHASEEQLAEMVKDISVFARVSPNIKCALFRLYRPKETLSP